MGESVGTLLDLDVTGIAHGGISVARHEGRVVFVSDAIPGERVTARVTEDRKKSFWRADTVSVETPSEHRVDHVWPEAALDRDPAVRAGGAEFGHIALGHQRTLKHDVLVDSFARFARTDLAAVLGHDVVVEAAPGDDESNGTGWRTRVRLHVDEDGTAGPFAARSHTVVPVASLPLASRVVQESAPLGRGAMPGASVVDVLAPSGSEGARLVIDEQKPTVVTEVVGERSFSVDDNGFWQVHRAAPAVLTAAVQDLVDRDRLDPEGQHLDLYGGVGLLGAALGDLVGPRAKLTSVESSERATEHAQENLSEWIGARAETGRVDRWLQRTVSTLSAGERQRHRAGTIVLDPPRSGAGREVVVQIAALQPAQVVYVACDPVALARDVATFADLGYRLEALRAFDLFPHTHHLEAVARLVPVA
ncbi:MULTISPECIES: class I SAM-dependent RNA methyltransferase [unclassified Curtobacterium]|jgi:tRNA/tmRNA/rRNA uracil-C5-methylase (TrmA/RlmC/RlmD family)|uniref:class I SAM-dependent RNA methyltransferase n=1 Tax=unclassified Curtobacterium TaxID=257496 RepID=UPI00089E03BC|nr:MULTISPECIES: TRAM domain-containing protein [unclassified Curtobacterium]AOX66751.1 23S rRNA methyltransferase [Curtobacterium sp. BH-2-1-1]MDR6172187.1 tRNA/tmRNA/rRNA uracil-C5-methylase (TrmA/RlmC/RlmD family) [Curtobacterium sp. SORGH_AS_0776]MDR6571947.1 tRNA/tmRNA/rRNA uracil-C5-methylase (TrmA/RlmC/RlmD family) [Curtobacterium sp. 320]SFF66625.1 tRNA/tmRNA/rRNA uracil-C5-methylase, TrmA/RlmC/RlmD family [Curtobacterium sp. YR515]